MQTTHAPYREPLAPLENAEPLPSLSHFVHTITTYRPIILLVMISAAILYTIFGILFYLLGPSQRVTSLPFRLDFTGAATGTYPNGKKFSTNDVITLPILLKVYRSNNLEQYTPFDSFARAIYVSERNRAYERLMAEYSARLADPKISPVDRDRLEKEFEAKREGLNKNEFAINYSTKDETRGIPDAIVRRVLSDILAGWARYAAVQQKALNYDVPVLSPDFINGVDPVENNYIASLQVLRSRIGQVVGNLDLIGELPGVNLIRTRDNISLEEIRIRLEGMARFRVEPLAKLVETSGLVGNRTMTIDFIQSQLAYDQRELRGYQQKIEAIRQTLSAYSQGLPGGEFTASLPGKTAQSRAGSSSGETLMPQISDTFIDRIVQMSNFAADQQYRQKLSEELRTTSVQMIPAQASVDYDNQLLESLKHSSAIPNGVTADHIQRQIDVTKSELRELIAKMNEIYRAVSETLNPATQMYTLTAPPTASMQRGVSASRLVLYGVVFQLLVLPVVVLLCLLHNRVREEEAAEEYPQSEHVRAAT